MRWDVFCQLIDNYGDVGVCWRLARNLAQRGQQVRLWVDDATPLRWMTGLPAGTLATGQPTMHQGIALLPWQSGAARPTHPTPPIAPGLLPGASTLSPPDVLVEAFGCEIPPSYLQALATAGACGQPWPAWFNLEYLSAQGYVERMHGLPSPVMHGPARGQSKVFFYPGFTPATGGLLREPDLLQRQAAFDANGWRQAMAPGHRPDALWISLFAYEPACLLPWLVHWAGQAQSTGQPTTQAPVPGPAPQQPVHLLAAAGRSQAHLRHCWQQLGWPMPTQPQAPWQHGLLQVHLLDFMPQDAYDALLWACDLNIVRGEDSLVRALWAGKPLLWHIYPQEDDAHHAKLQAFLDWLQAPPDWQRSMYALNAMHPDTNAHTNAQGNLQASTTPTGALPTWQPCAQAARQRLLAQPDLASALIARAQQQRGFAQPHT